MACFQYLIKCKPLLVTLVITDVNHRFQVFLTISKMSGKTFFGHCLTRFLHTTNIDLCSLWIIMMDKVDHFGAQAIQLKFCWLNRFFCFLLQTYQCLSKIAVKQITNAYNIFVTLTPALFLKCFKVVTIFFMYKRLSFAMNKQAFLIPSLVDSQETSQFLCHVSRMQLKLLLIAPKPVSSSFGFEKLKD